MTESTVRPERIQHTIIVPASLDMVAVVGVGDEVLRAIEAEFPALDIHVRGNQITLTGGSGDLHLVKGGGGPSKDVDPNDPNAGAVV